MELISVIIPVYNVEPYLYRCVNSVRNQTYENLEIILVDDGSPDRCPQMCDDLQKMDSRIKVIHKENGGLGLARNSGLDATTGAYVTFIDSDDWISQHHIENLYNAMRQNGADMAIGAYTSVSATGEKVEYPLKLNSEVYEFDSIISDLLLPLVGPDVSFPKDVQFSSSSCMNLYRMGVICENSLRFRSERIAVAEDMFFNVDFLMHANRVVLTSETGYFYYENPGSISRKYDPKRFERTIRFYDTLKSQMHEYDLVKRAVYRVERTFLMKIRVAIRHLIMSELPIADKIAELRIMLNNPLVQQVVHDYPIYSMNPAIRLLTKLIQKKSIAGVYLLTRIRELARHQDLLKKLLMKLGIGR